MSYDLNILCVNQSIATSLPFASSIELRSEFESSACGRYNSIWCFMSSLNGVWYTLGREEDGWFNAMSIIDADFEKVLERNTVPLWILDDDILSNLSPIIMCNEYRKDFEKIVYFLIQQSAIKTVLFLARYQGGETEIIEGVLQYEVFVRLLRQSQILFNVCYIIRD